MSEVLKSLDEESAITVDARTQRIIFSEIEEPMRASVRENASIIRNRSNERPAQSEENGSVKVSKDDARGIKKEETQKYISSPAFPLLHETESSRTSMSTREDHPNQLKD